MRAACIPLLAAALMAGCAPVPTKPHVSMADVDPLRRAVVTDVVNAVAEVYEATATVLVPVRTTSGAFDTALWAALRSRGFTVNDQAGSGARFDCHVDPIEGSMYRVTAKVGQTSLSRLWVLDGERAYPGGAWARRE